MKSLSIIRPVIAGLLVLDVAVTASQAAQEPAAAKSDLKTRAGVYASWSPERMTELRKQYGLIGPGPVSKPPEPRFPSYLRPLKTIEDLMPAARAAVAQIGGRVPLGLADPRDQVLIVVSYNANPLVQQAIQRAYQERKIKATIKYENELAGVAKADHETLAKVEEVMPIGDGQQELNFFFEVTGLVPNPEAARDWVNKQDPALYKATWPKVNYSEARFAKLSKDYARLVDKGLIKYLDQHPEITKVYWGLAARPLTRRRLGEHGDKLFGNYTYINHYDISSQVPAFPGDVWRLIETKTIEPLGFVDRIEVSDPEGTAIAVDLSPEIARRWAAGVYLQGHLYMLPSQATGRWPYSLVTYPLAAKTGYLQPAQLEVSGVVASTNSHRAVHPRIEVHLDKGRISKVVGGGWYGEGFRLLLNYPGTQNLTWPFFDKPGYWWLYEAGTATNPKYFKHPGEILQPVPPRELLSGGNLSERNVGGVIHWAFGTEVQNGPETPGGGKLSPKTIEFGERYNVPIGHSMHNHNLFPTYQVRIRDTGQWQTLIEHGNVASLSDPEVRALAARYGDPDQLLHKDFVHPVPGINIPGKYDDYGKNPGEYWTRWAKDIDAGVSRYLK